jgi:hypothetical protein
VSQSEKRVDAVAGPFETSRFAVSPAISSGVSTVAE